MKLVYTKSHGRKIKKGDLVKIGDRVLTTDGDPIEVVGLLQPASPASSGKVIVKFLDDIKAGLSGIYTFYVSVIDAEWIEREDRYSEPVLRNCSETFVE